MFELLNNISEELSKNYEMDINEKKEKERTRIKINEIDIDLIDCYLKRILINNKNEEKFIEIKREIIDLILQREKGEKNTNLLFEKISMNCENILDERDINMKISTKKRILYEESEKNIKKSLDNNNILLINKNKKNLDNEQNNNKSIIKSSENMFDSVNKKRRVLSANLNIINKNRINSNKKKIKGELLHSDSESSEEPSFYSKFKYMKPITCKSLSMTKSRKDLDKNRIMRNSYLIKNDFNLKKVEKILSSIKRKKYEENIYKNY